MPEQDARYEPDAWEDAIGPFLVGKQKVTILEVAKDSLFLTTARIGTADQRRISAALTRLSWHQKRTGKARWWEPN